MKHWIETRLLIHKPDGWVAYPYIWNAEETEAVYSPVGGKQVIETISPDGEALTINYAVPNRNQCKECHSQGEVFTPIGPSARNLNHVGPAGVNQLADWTERGILTGAPADAPAAPPAVWRCAAGGARAGVARHQLRALSSRGRRRVELRAVPGVE